MDSLSPAPWFVTTFSGLLKMNNIVSMHLLDVVASVGEHDSFIRAPGNACSTPFACLPSITNRCAR